MNFHLVPLSPDGCPTNRVKQTPFRIGRCDDCDLQIESGSISRHHCELIIQNGELFVRDLDSANGTFVNGERIYTDHALADGDLLALDVLIYRIDFHTQDDAAEELNAAQTIGHLD